MPLGSNAQLDHMLKVAGGAGSAAGATENVVFGEQRAFGTIEMVDDVEEADGVPVQVRRTTLLLRRGALPGLTRGSALQADEIDYKVRNIAREDDGAMIRVTLVEA